MNIATFAGIVGAVMVGGMFVACFVFGGWRMNRDEARDGHASAGSIAYFVGPLLVLGFILIAFIEQ